MAKKMGYQNFVELGYYRMGRLCYGPEEVKQFLENVLPGCGSRGCSAAEGDWQEAGGGHPHAL